jgi:hypothetical protein
MHRLEISYGMSQDEAEAVEPTMVGPNGQPASVPDRVKLLGDDFLKGIQINSTGAAGPVIE